MKVSITLSQEIADVILYEGSGSSLRVVETRTVERRHLREFLSNIKKPESVRISLDLEDVVLEVYSFPPARGRILRDLIKAELSTILTADYQFDYELMEEYREGENLRRRVFVTAIPTHILEALLEEIGFSPEFVTVYPASTRALLKERNLLQGTTAFIELREDGVQIIIFKDNYIRIVRKLPPYESEIGALSRDILQTLFFHKQIYQGESVDKIVVAGRKLTDDTLEVLSKDLEIPVETLEGVEGEFPSSIGNIYLSRHDSFTFIPPTLKRKRYVRYANITLASILAFTLIVQAFRISSLTGQLRGALNYARGLREFIESKEKDLLSMREELIDYHVKLAQPALEDVMLELSAIVPPGVRINELTISKDGHFLLKAKGTVEEGTPVERLILLDEMLKKSKNSPLLLEPSMMYEVDGRIVRFEFNATLPAKRSLK